MKKIVFLFFILCMYFNSFGQIFEPEGLNMPGDWNGWSNPPTINALAGIQKTGGTLLPIATGVRRYHTVIKVAASGDLVAGSYSFKFSSGSTSNYWANAWGDGTFVVNTLTSLNIGGATLDNTITLANDKWYTVNWKDAGYVNTQAIFMETSGDPVTISGVSDNFSGAGNDVLVTVSISGSKSAEEKIYVRYTKDSWTTSSFLLASGSGTTYTATIPGVDVTGTASSNNYYVFTTTVATPTHSDADMQTINLSNNSEQNYPLPVELTSFSASVKNKSVNLVWYTATEINNYGFEIEKRQSSTANSQWSKVGFVNGNGNSNSANEYSYTDKTVTSGKYTYRLKQIDNDGKYEYSKEVEVDLGKPRTFALNQNYPNPFNPSTSIQYSVVGSQYVSLKVFNVLGKEVAVLVNEKQEPGTYTVDFTSANLSGGAYFYRLQAGEFMQTKKMILLK